MVGRFGANKASNGYIYCHISGHIKKRNTQVIISSWTKNVKKRVDGSLQKQIKKQQINRVEGTGGVS